MHFYMLVYIKETMFSLGQRTLPPISLSNEKPTHPLVIALREETEIQERRNRFRSYDFVIRSRTVALPPQPADSVWVKNCFLRWVTVAKSCCHSNPTVVDPARGSVPPLFINNTESDIRILYCTKNDDKRYSF